MSANIFPNEGAQARFIMSSAPSVAAIAGFGSGKTHGNWIKIFKWLNDYPGVPMGYFAPTYALIRDIFIPEVEEFCQAHGIKSRFSKSESKLYVQGYAPVYCRSMMNPETIVGFKIGHAAVDEIDILSMTKAWEAWRKIKARCRIKLYPIGMKKKRENEVHNQMALSSTPEGYKFAFQAFKKNPLRYSELYQMSTYDNEYNLSANYIEELKQNYPKQLIEAYINGVFTNLTSGRVWIGYDRILNRSNEEWDGREPVILGMDFNVSRGCVVIYVKRTTGFHAVDEIYNTADTPASVKIIDDRYADVPISVIPDATGKNRKSVNATISDITLLKQANYRVIKNESNPNVKDRVMATNALFCNGLGERRLYVNDDLCPRLADALEQQVYDNNGQPEKGEGKQDDITDAASYPIAKLFPIKKRNSRLLKVSGI